MICISKKRQKIIDKLKLIPKNNKFTSNQSTKFRTNNWVEINDDRLGRYEEKNLKFKSLILNVSLCDYSDVYTRWKKNSSC